MGIMMAADPTLNYRAIYLYGVGTGYTNFQQLQIVKQIML